MFLRNKFLKDDGQSLIALGQVCLAVGILFRLLGTTQVLHRIVPHASSLDFVQGFFSGLSAILVGISIVFNVRGMVLRRQSSAS